MYKVLGRRWDIAKTLIKKMAIVNTEFHKYDDVGISDNLRCS
jgi:hypothetical protein